MEDLNSLLFKVSFPDDPWIFIEPDGYKVPLENIIKSWGKYVIYGSKGYTESLAKKLEKNVGKNIREIKYSKVPVSVTPNAPENSYAVIVYCDIMTRDNVMKTLEELGVGYFEWKSDRQSLLEYLNDPYFCFFIYTFNRERLMKICKLLDREDVFEKTERLAKLSSTYAKKFRKLAKLVKQKS